MHIIASSTLTRTHTLLLLYNLPDTESEDRFDPESHGKGGSESEGSTSAFSLLIRRASDIVIPPKGLQQIGISFIPERLGEYTASVQIRSCES